MFSWGFLVGAQRTRTLDPLIKSQLLSGKCSVTETDFNLITWTELYGDECCEPPATGFTCRASPPTSAAPRGCS